jgi:hypothetical protein
MPPDRTPDTGRIAVQEGPATWRCSGCGRVFSIWTITHHSYWTAAHDAQRTTNLVGANARRHAAACKETL